MNIQITQPSSFSVAVDAPLFYVSTKGDAFCAINETHYIYGYTGYRKSFSYLKTTEIQPNEVFSASHSLSEVITDDGKTWEKTTQGRFEAVMASILVDITNYKKLDA